jgi:hypothetical protein
MSLLDVVRSGVAIANSVTNSGDLQASVMHEHYTESAQLAANKGVGKRTLDAAVSRPALVQKKQQMVRTASGELVQSKASVVFLDPAVLVTLFDKITLPDGTTGPILSIEGFVDKRTGQPILTEVYLG